MNVIEKYEKNHVDFFFLNFRVQSFELKYRDGGQIAIFENFDLLNHLISFHTKNPTKSRKVKHANQLKITILVNVYSEKSKFLRGYYNSKNSNFNRDAIYHITIYLHIVLTKVQ